MSFEVLDACTLPTAERPLRLAELDELFATVHRVEPVSAEHVRMWLTGPAGLEEKVRDLAARETECCSYFSFTVIPQAAGDGEALWLDITVPAKYTEVLDSLAQRAVTVSAR